MAKKYNRKDLKPGMKFWVIDKDNCIDEYLVCPGPKDTISLRPPKHVKLTPTVAVTILDTTAKYTERRYAKQALRRAGLSEHKPSTVHYS